MTTKNYVIQLADLCLLEVYNKFRKDFEENLVETMDVKGSNPSKGTWVGHYDINYTAVLIRSDNNFNSFSNLRITGLENNIKQTEKEIELRGFKLNK